MDQGLVRQLLDRERAAVIHDQIGMADGHDSFAE